MLRTVLITFLCVCLVSCAKDTSTQAHAPKALSDQTSSIQTQSPLNRILFRGTPLYLSGFNIAWFSFASDFGHGLNASALRVALQDLVDAGGNTIRWWVHIDGSTTPAWSSAPAGEKAVVGPGGTLISDLEQALNIADEYGVYIVPSLWSFDMLKNNNSRMPPTQDNFRLLTNDGALEAYINNALIPMVKALNNHPRLVAWELFNEPENMTEPWLPLDKNWYGGVQPTLAQLQRTQAKMAAAIHRTAIDMGQIALVTTGSKSMAKYNSDVIHKNLYRDDRLINAADGDPLATLDFYQPHYYNNEGQRGEWSVFHHNAAYWKVDKPIVIGEFFTRETLDVLNDPIEPEDFCQRLFNNGYAGGWAWQWIEEKKLRPTVLQCVANVGIEK